MAPLLFVEGGSGTCGAWNDLLLVGWTDGKLTALSPTDGSLYGKIKPRSTSLESLE